MTYRAPPETAGGSCEVLVLSSGLITPFHSGRQVLDPQPALGNAWTWLPTTLV